MHDEQGKKIMPSSYIPIAEGTVMIHEIDRWVVENAIK